MHRSLYANLLRKIQEEEEEEEAEEEEEVLWERNLFSSEKVAKARLRSVLSDLRHGRPFSSELRSAEVLEVVLSESAEFSLSEVVDRLLTTSASAVQILSQLRLTLPNPNELETLILAHFPHSPSITPPVYSNDGVNDKEDGSCLSDEYVRRYFSVVEVLLLESECVRKSLFQRQSGGGDEQEGSDRLWLFVLFQALAVRKDEHVFLSRLMMGGRNHDSCWRVLQDCCSQTDDSSIQKQMKMELLQRLRQSLLQRLKAMGKDQLFVVKSYLGLMAKAQMIPTDEEIQAFLSFVQNIKLLPNLNKRHVELSFCLIVVSCSLRNDLLLPNAICTSGTNKTSFVSIFQEAVRTLYSVTLSKSKPLFILTAVLLYTSQLPCVVEFLSKVIGCPNSIILPMEGLFRFGEAILKPIFNENVMTKEIVESVPILPDLNSLNKDTSITMSLRSFHVLMREKSFLRHGVDPSLWLQNQLKECSLPIHPCLPGILMEFIDCLFNKEQAQLVLKGLTSDFVEQQLLSLSNMKLSGCQVLVLFYALQYNHRVARGCSTNKQTHYQLTQHMPSLRFVYQKLHQSRTPDFEFISPLLMGLLAEQFPTTRTKNIDQSEEIMQQRVHTINLLFFKHDTSPTSGTLDYNQLIQDPLCLFGGNLESMWQNEEQMVLFCESLCHFRSLCQQKNKNSEWALVQDMILVQALLESYTAASPTIVSPAFIDTLDWFFQTNPALLETLHYQGYDSHCIELMVEQVNSIRQCSKFTFELIQSAPIPFSSKSHETEEEQDDCLNMLLFRLKFSCFMMLHHSDCFDKNIKEKISKEVIYKLQDTLRELEKSTTYSKHQINCQNAPLFFEEILPFLTHLGEEISALLVSFLLKLRAAMSDSFSLHHIETVINSTYGQLIDNLSKTV